MTAERGRGPVDGGWRETIAPMTQRLRVTAALPGFEARWNSVGARAFLSVLEEMAHKLDVVAPARIEELRRERDLAVARLEATERELSEARARISELERMRNPHWLRFLTLLRSGRVNGEGGAAGP
jgi:hypothetical protein